MAFIDLSYSSQLMGRTKEPTVVPNSSSKSQSNTSAVLQARLETQFYRVLSRQWQLHVMLPPQPVSWHFNYDSSLCLSISSWSAMPASPCIQKVSLVAKPKQVCTSFWVHRTALQDENNMIVEPCYPRLSEDLGFLSSTRKWCIK